MSEKEASELDFWGEVDGTEALQRYRTLVNTVNDGIYQLDASGRFVAVNDIICELTGYPREALLGEHVSLLLEDDDIERIAQEIYRRYTTGEAETETFEFTAQTVDGESIHCELQLSLLVDDGSFQGTVGVVRDITDRKQTEQQLREREQQLQRERDLTTQVLDTSPVGIMVLDAEGEVTRLNDRAKELLAVATVDAFTPSDTPTYDEDGHRLSEDEYPWLDPLATGDAVSDRILQVDRPDGNRRWLSVNATPVLTDDGNIDRVITTLEDITDIKEREQRLEHRTDELSTELEEIYSRITDGVIALNEAWEFTHVNERAEEILFFNRDEAELRGTTIWDAFPELQDTAFEEHYREAMATQEPHTFEAYYPPHDTWYEEHVYPSETGLSIYFRDITERKRLEAELKDVYGRISDAFFALDTDWQFTHLNERAHELINPEGRKLEGKNVWEEFPAAVKREFKPKYEQAMYEQETVSFEEYYPEPLDIWVEVRAYPSETGLSVYFRDVTDRKEREQELRESERKFRMLAENLEEVVWMATPEADEVLYVNPAYEDVWGDDRASLYEDPYAFAEAVHPDDRDRVVSAAEDVPESEFDEEYRIVRPDGETRWINARVLPVTDEDGAVVRIVGIAQDVTERREMEEELRESEAKFRQMAEHLEQVVWMTTDDQREVLYVNPAFEEVYGHDREEVYENAEFLLEVVHPEDREMVLEELDKVVTDEYEVEYRIVRPDGEVRWIHDRATPVFDEDGNLYRVVGDANDITERKERERALEKSERRYRTLAEHFPGGVVAVYDEDFRYTLIEGAALDDLGLEAADVEGKTVEELFPPEPAADIVPLFEAAIDAGETNTTTTEFAGRHWQVWATPLADSDGEIFAGLSFAQDITDQVEYERQLEELIQRLEESNERLEQFAYAASHDLQEPLRMVSSYLQLIDRRYGDDLDEEGAEFLEYAVDGADRMRNMIEGLLQYSRVDTGGDSFEPVALDEVFADVCENLQVKIEEHDAKITVDSLPRVDGDAGQLQQVFQNLLDNAIVYSGDEPPRVHVSAERVSDGDEWLISVSDEGIGIDPDDADQIFEVFQSLHGPDEYDGTGIGLALCERIVERHGGDIWVDSEPGEGATFSFTLPAADGGDGDE